LWCVWVVLLVVVGDFWVVVWVFVVVEWGRGGGVGGGGV